jgi:hypothetical protein
MLFHTLDTTTNYLKTISCNLFLVEVIISYFDQTEHRTYFYKSYAFFVFGTATFWQVNGKAGAKKLKISYR